jgi:hypothetical protein
MKHYNDLLNRHNVSANRYNGSESVITVQKPCNGCAGAGTRVRVRAAAAGTRAASKRVWVQRIFSKKN